MKNFRIKISEQTHPKCFPSNEFTVSILDERGVLFPESYILSSKQKEGYIALTQSRYTKLNGPDAVDPEMNRRHFGTAYDRDSAEELLHSKAVFIAEELAVKYGADENTAEVVDLTGRTREQ
ncbi:MAG: hypothetical protein WC533_02460 [Candidatus Pacearchaeota archaeon]